MSDNNKKQEIKLLFRLNKRDEQITLIQNIKIQKLVFTELTVPMIFVENIINKCSVIKKNKNKNYDFFQMVWTMKYSQRKQQYEKSK